MRNPLRRAYNQLSRLIINEGFANLAKKYKLQQNTSDYNDAKAVYQAINRNDKLKNFYKREMVSKLNLSDVSKLGDIDSAYSKAFPTVEEFLDAYNDYVTPKDGVIPYEAKIKQAVEDNQLNKLRTDRQNLIKRYDGNVVEDAKDYIVYKVRTFEEAKQMRWLWMGDVEKLTNEQCRKRDPKAPDDSQSYGGKMSPEQMADYMMSNDKFIMNPSWCVCAGKNHWSNYNCGELNDDGSAACHLIFSKRYPNCRFCVVRNDYVFEIRDPWQGGGFNRENRLQYGYKVMLAVFGNKAVEKIECLHGVAKYILATKLAAEFIGALEQGNIEGAEQMLEHGADVNGKNDDGETPLLWAALNGHTKICQFLLDHGADVNAGHIVGVTPLHVAAANDHTETCELLLENGADVNGKSNDDKTSLHWAAYNGHTETCELLLERGAKVNAKDKDGKTPLHWAAENGHTETCELLRQYGADANAKDKQ